jgi:hypothetical protein
VARIAPDRLILQLTDDELEKFVRQWALRRPGYVEVQLLSGTSDRGRDVVGRVEVECLNALGDRADLSSVMQPRVIWVGS